MRKFFLFYEKNEINIDLLINIFKILNKNISLDDLKDAIKLVLIDIYDRNDNISKAFAKIIYKFNKWDIKEIYKFLNSCYNCFNKLNQLQIDVIEDAFKEYHFSFNKQNNKGQTILDIFKNYTESDWEYKIKQLGLPTKSNNERNLDEIFSEILRNNPPINEEKYQKYNNLLRKMDKLKEIYNEYEYEFRKERGDKKSIEKWEKEDIIKWVNSEKTKENINKEFLNQSF